MFYFLLDISNGENHPKIDQTPLQLPRHAEREETGVMNITPASFFVTIAVMNRPLALGWLMTMRKCFVLTLNCS